jgi:hypothetical protein
VAAPTDPADEMTANSVHENHMSTADLAICGAFDIITLSGEAKFDEIMVLRDTLQASVPVEGDADDAASVLERTLRATILDIRASHTWHLEAEQAILARNASTSAAVAFKAQTTSGPAMHVA